MTDITPSDVASVGKTLRSTVVPRADDRGEPCTGMHDDMAHFLKEHRLLLAPMAGVTDAAFRDLCLEQGAQLTYTEMISAKGLSYANERTGHLLDLGEAEDLVAVQLFGHEPDTMASQAAWIEQEMGEKLAFIDINMGCPARKIVSKGDGASLMQRPDEAAAVISSVSAAVSKPVTVKFRRGYRNDEDTAVSFARMAEAAGAAAVAVHGRFAEQLYHGHADWGTIARVKAAVSIPVIGNGDVKCARDAVAMLESTSCDAIMVGRAARGNPWIFAECRAALEGRPGPEAVDAIERIEMARRHAILLSRVGRHALIRMRKHASWYFSGLHGASGARERLYRCSTIEDFLTVFDDLKGELLHRSGSCRPADESMSVEDAKEQDDVRAL